MRCFRNGARDSSQRGFPTIEFSPYRWILIAFADDQFDLITSFQVIEHIADTASYSRDQAGLRPGGTAL